MGFRMYLVKRQKLQFFYSKLGFDLSLSNKEFIHPTSIQFEQWARTAYGVKREEEQIYCLSYKPKVCLENDTNVLIVL